MVTLPLSIIPALLVGLPLLVLLALALMYNFRSLHRPVQHHESIYECSNCNHVYAIARNRPMDRCSRCGSLNEAIRV